MSHIACLDAADAEDEPGLVEEGARSQSILNILRLKLQSTTSTTLNARVFCCCYRHLAIMYDIKHDIKVSLPISENGLHRALSKSRSAGSSAGCSKSVMVI